MVMRHKKGKIRSKSKTVPKWKYPYGKTFKSKEIPNRRYYVVATDEGWSRSTTAPKTAKIIVPTNSYKQAKTIEKKWKNFDNMKYVSIRTTKPYYDSKQYHVSVRRPSQVR